MEELKEILSESQFKLWVEYSKYQELNIKKKARICLDKLIKDIKENNSEKVNEIGEFFYTQRLDFQFPFFQQIIFPAIIDGVKKNKLGFNRMLAESGGKLYSSKPLPEILINEINYPRKFFEPEYFLEKELINNPNDKLASIMLVQKKAQSLDFAIHEIPNYLLFDENIFKEKVNELENLINKYNLNSDKWDKRLKLLKSISFCWSEYLLTKTKYFNFRDYIEKNQEKSIVKPIIDWNKCFIYDR